jgi:MoxR-like ATPase/predicted RNA-binding protein with PUA-like domain
VDYNLLKSLILKDNYLNVLLKRYLLFKNNPLYDEKYKWDILGDLNTHLQHTSVTSENVVSVIKYIKSKNPQAGSFAHWSSIDNLMKLAEEQPDLTASLLVNVYNESLALEERIDEFYRAGKEHGKTLGAPLFGYLLAAFDYKKYPLYKEEVLQEIKKKFGINKKLGSISENYVFFYEICQIVQEYVHDQGYEFSMLDVQDMLFSGTYYYTLIAEVSAEYLYSVAVGFRKFMENDQLFLNEIKEMDESELEERRSFYRSGIKVNRIRFLLLDQWLEHKTLTLDDLERIKQQVKAEYDTNILQVWNNFRILFQIYYHPIKERVQNSLANLHECIRHIDGFNEAEFEEYKSLNGFGWNQNYGGSECWLAVYPKAKESHKKAAQLFLSIDAGHIRYGLGYGSEHPNRESSWDIDPLEDINDFTYGKLELKFKGVYQRFLRENQMLSSGEIHETEEEFMIEEGNDIKYFWMTANPSIWTIDNIKDGSEAFYTAYNEKGNKRRLFQSFETAAPGDKIIFYESTPRKEIVGEGEVTKGLHTESEPGFSEPVKGVSFKFVKDVSPITWEQIIKVEELQESAPVKNAAQGSLFPLTKEEYEGILAIEEPVVEEYQVEIPKIDFSREVEINGLHFEDKGLILKQVKTALSKGKHIILIGPPGTGKSKMAKEICRSFDVEYEMTTATSDWSTYETIGGNRPNSDGTLSFQQGLFLNCFKDSKTNQPLNKWLIIDEMNRADIDKAFGAMFSALTGDKITLSFQGKSGQNISVIPENRLDQVILNDYEYIISEDWRLLGTMNTIDKASLYEMSYAFMRRFAFIPVGVPKDISEELVDSYLPLWGIDDYKYSEVLAQFWAYINDYRQIGPAIIEDLAKFTEGDGDFTSAVILYVLPQFEGLQDFEITEFVDKLGQLDGIEKDRLMEFSRDFFHIKE